MEQFKEFMFTVWREACRHIEIAESAATIAGNLVRRMPIDRLISVGLTKTSPASRR